MKRLALLAALLALWGTPALAAPGTPTTLGQGGSGASVTTFWIPMGADSAVGSTNVVFVVMPSTSAWGVTDTSSGGNTYTIVPATPCILNTNYHTFAAYAKIANDLPAPTTATGSITTTVVTFTTNPGTLAVDQSITGTGVTANTAITGGLSQWNGTSASATVNNSQSVVSETLTVSQSIKVTWTTAGKPNGVAVNITGLDTSSPLDITSACSTAATDTTLNSATGIATGTLNNASEIIIGAIGASGSMGTFTPGGSFTAMTAPPGTGVTAGLWAYQIVSSTASVTFNPSWSIGRPSAGFVITLKAPGAAGTGHNLSLLGVGS